MIEGIIAKLEAMHCKCGLSCKSMWVAVAALIISIWAATS